MDLIGSGRLNAAKLITKTITLEEVKDVMDDLHTNPDDYIKVIIDPSIKRGKRK